MSLRCWGEKGEVENAWEMQVEVNVEKEHEAEVKPFFWFIATNNKFPD